MSTASSSQSAVANPLSPTATTLQSAHHQAATPSRSLGSSLRRVVLYVGALAGALWLGSIALGAYRYAKTDNAYVVGHLHEISTQVDGQVAEVLVKANQTVKAGDPLLRLDALPFEIAVQKAEAAAAQARAQESEVAAAASSAIAHRAEAAARAVQADALIEQARAQFELAQSALSRSERLMQAGGVATQAELDNSRAANNAGKAALDAATADRAAAQAAVASADAAISAAKSQASAASSATAVAAADLQEARRRLSQATVLAPAAGRIGNRHVEAGNRVQAGQVLLALAEDETWVVANFKETDVGRFHAGEDASVTIDALPGLALHGTIDSISPASGAQFALLPPDNATGNFTKVVQRVPVKIVLDDASQKLAAPALRLGYSAVVRIRIR